MSNERFDKILKKNLESVRPAYKPQAWERFAKKLPVVGFLPWMQHYGGWVISGMMLAGWITTLFALQENQRLIRQLASRQNVSAQVGNAHEVKTNAPEPVPSRQDSRQIDTVYIVKKTIIEHRYVAKASALNIESPISADQQPTRNSHHDVTKSANSNAMTWPSTDHAIREDIDEDVAKFSKNAVNQKTGPSTPGLKELHSLISPAKDSSDLSDNEELTAAVDSIVVELTNLRRLTQANLDSLHKKDVYAEEQKTPVLLPRKPFRLSSLQPRLGIESMLTRNGYGLGPTIELFPNENLGISIGMQASVLETQNHKMLKDYNTATGKLFSVQYSSYLPAKYDRIQDISIQTSLISLPVSLKYYVPAADNLSLFFQAGTSLDLSAYQQVNFESFLNGRQRRNSFETDAKARLFHDFMFGAGLQYRKKRILAQLSPYYVYDFRNIENTPSGSNLGLRASVWLNLYK